MKRWLLIAAGVACTPAADNNSDGTESNGAETGPTDDGQSSDDPSGDDQSGDDANDDAADDTTDSGGQAEDTSATDGSTSDGASESSSGGEPACADADLPAEFSEVRGCPAVLGQSFCSEGQGHVEIGTDIEYANNPPHSGPHFPMWEAWGEHVSTIERGYWVHNMEHGGIVLSYLCPDGCEEDLAVLRAVLEQRPDSRILITPDPLLTGSRFAAVSWTWVHEFESADVDELLCFVDQHFNHAPEDVP